MLIRSLTTFLCVNFNITNCEVLPILQTHLENLKGKPVSIVLLGLTLTKFLSFLVVHRVRETINYIYEIKTDGIANNLYSYLGQK